MTAVGSERMSVEALTVPVQSSRTAWFADRLNTDKPQLALGVAALVLFLLLPEWLGSAYWGGISKLFTLYAAAAIFMSILYVDAGQTSFGQGAIFGAGAYMVAIAAGTHGLPFWLSALCGVGAALVGGALFALPALRVQWFYLGFVTLSAAMVFPELLIAFNAYTNGISGISIPFTELRAPVALGLSPLVLMIAALGAAAMALQVWLPRTPLGRRMRVAAAAPEAAQSLGTSPGAMRSIAFLVAAFGTGLAGALYPPTVGFVSPNAFHVELSILFFFALIVGGTGQPLGPLVGLVLLYLVPNVFLARFVEYRLLIYGCMALVVMLLMPHGVIGTLETWRRRAARRGGEALRLDKLIGAARAQKADHAAADVPSGLAVEVAGVRKSFGRVKAIDGVDLTVRSGEIHGLVGANGSGKTSLLNVLSGFSRVDEGVVRVAGVVTNEMAAHRIARLGVGRTFQTPRILAGLSVWENLEIGIDARSGATGRAIPDASIAELRGALINRSIETVPHGQRRLLEVMRIVLKEADILLLDEPAAGLSPDERKSFSELLRDLRDHLGKTIVLVEHDLDLVWSVADRITVLEAGKVVASGAPKDVAANPAVAHLFIGGRHA